MSLGLIQYLDRKSSKRKLEDMAPLDDLISNRTKKEQRKKEELEAESSIRKGKEEEKTSTSSACSITPHDYDDKCLHFFVRMMSGGNTIVIHANSDDSVESVHQYIRRKTGIPVMEQRLIYRGRQLQWEHKLHECGIQNDAGLQLVGRMRSTEFPKSWQCVNDLLSSVSCLCKAHSSIYAQNVKTRASQFLTMTPKDNNSDRAPGHVSIFKSSAAPTALVILFFSPIPGNKECARDAISHFLTPSLDNLPKSTQMHWASVVLEFTKLLSSRSVPIHDPLYASCRSTLANLFKTIGYTHGLSYFGYTKPADMIKDLFPFVAQLATSLSLSLDSSMDSSSSLSAPLDRDIRDFSAFLVPVCRAVVEHVGGENHLPINLHYNYDSRMLELTSLHDLYLLLLKNLEECLEKVEGILLLKGALEESEGLRFGWFYCLAVLKELNRLSKLYQGATELLASVMRKRRNPLNALIKYSKRGDDYYWLLEHKDVTDFESRRHLVMMMFPESGEDYEGLHEMLIDRSQLLEESFEYIAHTEPESLRGGLFMEFKNEEATGPGVLREWFYMVCQALFNRQNPLFLACPNDQRRFLPNPASKVDSLHLDYFCFCGRVIALALMHKIQVGIVFDRVFFLQLADKLVSLEDVRDADPCFYMSCKKILQMDAEFLDSDALGLTFVQEVEELGSRKVVELCPGGKGIIVDSKNREEYVNLLIKHRFVISTSEQVARFAQGFADILSDPSHRKIFFRSLELEDFDRMLHGSDRAICMEDWKAHTEYNGYKETDRQIHWFWKVVDGMPKEQQRVLLFFWTSVRYLPVDGFRGLASRLHIYRSAGSPDRLPSSHTCFYRLCLPPYPSLSVMRERVHVITQEHVSCSFGNW